MCGLVGQVAVEQVEGLRLAGVHVHRRSRTMPLGDGPSLASRTSTLVVAWLLMVIPLDFAIPWHHLKVPCYPSRRARPRNSPALGEAAPRNPPRSLRCVARSVRGRGSAVESAA